MGSWGVGLFSDDTACDVRDEYRQAVSEGLDAVAARDRVLERFADALDDMEDGPVVRLALAATAWKMGRLDDATRERALAIIAGREGMERWDEAGLGRKRDAELAKLAETLRSPQKPPAKPRKKPGFVSSWAVGEIIGYRQQTGRWLALHVVGHVQGDFGFPVVNLLDWASDEKPTEADLAQAVPILFPPDWDMTLPKKQDLCLILTRKLERSASFLPCGFERDPGRSGPFLSTAISYVGPELFEWDIVGMWQAQRA